MITAPSGTFLTMADSTDPAALAGRGVDAFGGYDNGNWADYEAIAAAHPGKELLDFTVFFKNLGTAGDFEPGDMVPSQAVPWTTERQAAGVWRPVDYASIGGYMVQIAQDLAAATLSRGSYRLLSAHYGWPGQLAGLARGQHVCGPLTCGSPVQCDGTQWIDHGTWDESLLSLGFFESTAPAPVPAPPGGWIVKPISGSIGKLNAPCIAFLPAPGGGYHLVGTDGGTFDYGCPHLGSLAGTKLNAPIVAASLTSSGAGMILVGADGGVFSFGNAPFDGSEGGKALAASITDAALTADDQGYWLMAADGGVFAFGDAPFHGSPA